MPWLWGWRPRWGEFPERNVGLRVILASPLTKPGLLWEIGGRHDLALLARTMGSFTEEGPSGLGLVVSIGVHWAELESEVT